MAYITICYIDGEPIVYETLISEEDKAKTEALFPGRIVYWEVRQVEGLAQVQQMMAGVSEAMTMVMTPVMAVAILSYMLKTMIV